MKKIKLSGREMAVVRAIDFATGTPGNEMFERTRIEMEELVGTINGLIEVGFVETMPYHNSITMEMLPKVTLEINPGYAQELKSALIRRF